MKNTGIWIDTQEARIVALGNGRIHVKVIFSGVSRKLRIAGEKSKKATLGSTGFDFKSSQQRQFQEELKKYYNSVAEHVRDSDNLYISGPADAKIQLEKTLKNSGMDRPNILAVENSDNVTDKQLIANIHDFFSERTKLKRTPRKLPRR